MRSRDFAWLQLSNIGSCIRIVFNQTKFLTFGLIRGGYQYNIEGYNITTPCKKGFFFKVPNICWESWSLNKYSIREKCIILRLVHIKKQRTWCIYSLFARIWGLWKWNSRIKESNTFLNEAWTMFKKSWNHQIKIGCTNSFHL